MKLDHVIRTYIGNKGDTTLHGYIKYLHYAIQGLKQTKVSLGYDLNTERLEVDDKKQATLPDDYLQWTSVSILSGDRMINMVYDATMADTSIEPREPYPSIEEYEFDNEFNFLVSQLDPKNITDTKGKGQGYFMIDSKAELVQFDSRLSIDFAYLTYISNKFRPSTETEVHPFVVDMIIEHIRWQEARYDRRFGEASAETQLRKREFLNKQDIAVGNFMNLNAELFVDILNRSTSRSPVRNV